MDYNFGLFLIVIGLLIIFLTLFTSYNIISGKSEPFQIFQTEEVLEEASTIEEEIIKRILPSESINELMNLIAWSIFSFIFIYGGAKISSLGVILVKKKYE